MTASLSLTPTLATEKPTVQGGTVQGFESKVSVGEESTTTLRPIATATSPALLTMNPSRTVAVAAAIGDRTVAVASSIPTAGGESTRRRRVATGRSTQTLRAADKGTPRTRSVLVPDDALHDTEVLIHRSLTGRSCLFEYLFEGFPRSPGASVGYVESVWSDLVWNGPGYRTGTHCIWSWSRPHVFCRRHVYDLYEKILAV